MTTDHDRRCSVDLAGAWTIVMALSPDDHQVTTPSMDALQRFLEGPMTMRLDGRPGRGWARACRDDVISDVELMALDLAHRVATGATARVTVVPGDEARKLLELVGRVVARLA